MVDARKETRRLKDVAGSVTAKDVAQRAEVSVGTVSRVFKQS